MHDEPDAAAVRRHPRPQGDELGHRQDGARARRGAARSPARSRTHIVRRRDLDNVLEELRPVQDARRPGSVAKAAAEMKQSKYDPGKTGKCTAQACKSVLLIADIRAVDKGMLPSSRPSAAKIGITFKVRTVNGAYPAIQTAVEEHPDLGAARLGQGLRRPVDVLRAAVRRPRDHPDGQHELLARRPHAGDRRRSVGVTGNIDSVPSIDADIDAASAKSATTRTTCWENLDRKLMTQVVPWVPYLWREQRQHRRPEGDEVEVRPVRRRPAYAHVSRSSSETEQTGRGAVAAPRPHSTDGTTTWLLYIARRLVWTSSSSSSCCDHVRRLLPPAGGRSGPSLRRQVADRRRARADPAAARPRPALVRRSSASSSKNFFAGDEYGWPGLGYSYVSSRSVHDADRRSARRGRCS